MKRTPMAVAMMVIVFGISRTDVFVKRNGRWQCVSFHGSRIIEPPK